MAFLVTSVLLLVFFLGIHASSCRDLQKCCRGVDNDCRMQISSRSGGFLPYVGGEMKKMSVLDDRHEDVLRDFCFCDEACEISNDCCDDFHEYCYHTMDVCAASPGGWSEWDTRGCMETFLHDGSHTTAMRRIRVVRTGTFMAASREYFDAPGAIPFYCPNNVMYEFEPCASFPQQTVLDKDVNRYEIRFMPSLAVQQSQAHKGEERMHAVLVLSSMHVVADAHVDSSEQHRFCPGQVMPHISICMECRSKQACDPLTSIQKPDGYRHHAEKIFVKHLREVGLFLVEYPKCVFRFASRPLYTLKGDLCERPVQADENVLPWIEIVEKCKA